MKKKHKVLNSKIINLGYHVQWFGSVQKISKDRYMIGCGSAKECTAQIIQEDGKPVWNLKVEDPYVTYRVYYYPKID